MKMSNVVSFGKIISMLAVCLALSACKSTPTPPQFDLCAEKQMVADLYKSAIEKVGTSTAAPSEEEVVTIVRPLSKNYTLDEAQCHGYTKQVRDASKAVVRKRAKEIIPVLQKICTRELDPQITDLALLAAMHEERLGANEALTILHESTAECSVN